MRARAVSCEKRVSVYGRMGMAVGRRIPLDDPRGRGGGKNEQSPRWYFVWLLVCSSPGRAGSGRFAERQCPLSVVSYSYTYTDPIGFYCVGVTIVIEC